MLNMLEGFNLTALGHNTAAYLHLHAEIKKLAFADASAYVADPDFNTELYPGVVEGLISKDYAAARAQEISQTAAAAVVDPGDPVDFEPSGHHIEDDASADTTYLTVADADGNMVSLIQSVYMHFGSGIVLPDLGFALQNRGALLNLDRSSPNAFAPGKRPYQTIMPGFVKKNGKPWLSFGVMGGFYQPQGQVQILCNMIDFGFDLQAAGDAARYYHTGSTSPKGERMTDGGTLQLEGSLCPDDVELLESVYGHNLALGAGNPGGYQAVLRDDDVNPGRITYFGASEMRKDGVALGL
mmetsp:Transcript_34207/g.107860  ORF Transcript_34207/g.107860 Transcript_34207/m.107860 type:complete len:297 (-) Transcript_34207:98-988(-)